MKKAVKNVRSDGIICSLATTFFESSNESTLNFLTIN